MIPAFIAAVAIAALLVLSEIGWKHAHLKDEVARKFVHITTGTFIATLGFWVPYEWIMVLAVGFVAVNVLNRYTNYFHAIHAVNRKSWGDVLLGVGVFIAAWLEPSAWVFFAAIVQVSLADGFAAIAGVTYGKKHGEYYLFGQPKTYIGSAVFALISILTLSAVLFLNPYYADPLSLLPFAVILGLTLTFLENLAVFGSDNLVLPIATILCLGLL